MLVDLYSALGHPLKLTINILRELDLWISTAPLFIVCININGMVEGDQDP